MEANKLHGSSIKDEIEIQEIKDFKEGVIPFFEKVQENAKMLNNVLNSNIMTNEEKKAIFYDIKDIEFKIKEIQNKARNLVIELSKDTILNEAQREYYAFFSDQITEVKMNFVILVLHFIKIKEFYEASIEALNFIKKIVFSKISPQSYFYQQFVDYQLKTIFIKMHKIDLFLKRLSLILAYKKVDQTENTKIYNLVQFSPYIDYRYSLIFKENLSDYIEKFFRREKTEAKQNVSIHKKILTSEIKETIQSKTYIQNNMLNTSGKYLWNSSLYYFLTYDPEQLKKEEMCFQNVFYIDNHLGATPELVKSQLIRSFLRNKTTFTIEEAKKRYINFLDSLFAINQQILCLNFKIKEEFSLLFMYHLGPTVFYSIIKQYLQDLKTGYLHQIQSKNLIRKSIPFEFIKRYLFDWWIQNILNPLSEEDRNNFTKYNQLNLHIQRFIFDISKKFKSQFPKEEVIWDNPKFQDFLKQNVGIVNLLLVQRYRNLFKHFEIK